MERIFLSSLVAIALTACDSGTSKTDGAGSGSAGSKEPDDSSVQGVTPVPENPASLDLLRKEGDWALAPAMQKTASGQQYVIVKDGEGETPPVGSTIRLHFRGWIIRDGKINRRILDSRTNDRAAPEEYLLSEQAPNYGGPGRSPFGLSKRPPQPVFLKSWVESIAQMRPGERRYVVAPSQLAWGSLGFTGAGDGVNIPPDTDIAFDIELVSFETR